MKVNYIGGISNDKIFEEENRKNISQGSLGNRMLAISGIEGLEIVLFLIKKFKIYVVVFVIVY